MPGAGSSSSFLDRLLGAAFTLALVAILLVVAIHLIESVLTALLIGLSALALAGLTIWRVQRSRRNRYW